MVFSSLIFLFLFLPAVIVVYYLTARRYRNAVLLLFSYIFYLWGSGWFLFLFLFSTLVDYLLALLIDYYSREKRRWWLTLSIVFNLSLLFYFKYANFFVAELNNVLSSWNVDAIGWTQVVLPIGISFFTFHKITYVIDIYRGTRKAFFNFIDYSLYLAFFPQLIAGPIIRFHEISDQFQNRRETAELIYQGSLRFCWGLIKKVVLANSCGQIAVSVFDLNVSVVDTKMAWLGVFAYTLQIYFDFSAYSDMAIGLGRMFGFILPENFNRPYSALSITDFWRRWHITLSNFFRDYLYIPLGGNRHSVNRTYFNLMIIFVLCGLWHGANWTFLIWGVYHGGLLIFERLAGLRTTSLDSNSSLVLRRFSTFILVMIGWLFFRADNMAQATALLKKMFIPVQMPIPLEVVLVLNGHNIFFILISALVIFLPHEFSGAQIILKKKGPVMAVSQLVILVIMVFYSVASIASGYYNPFIYFQF